MGYIYTFDIGSILFFSLTIFFYARQRRARDLSDQIYFVMLIAGLVALVFDCAAGAMEYRAMAFPVWLLYAVNMLFILAMQLCLPLFFIYVCVITGVHYRMTRVRHVLALLPYIVTMLLLFLSPFGTFGICYIDAGHIYRGGGTHMALYIDSFVYIVGSIVVLLAKYRTIQRARRNVILLFACLLFIAMALQLAFPRYLLTASATALALTSMFYVLQSPVDRINPYTGAVSRMLLPTLLADYHGRNRPYTLLQLSLHSFDEIIRLYGNQLSDSLLVELTKRLQNDFPRDTVIYMDTWEFAVLCDQALAEEDVRRIAERAPDTITVGGVEISLDVHVSAVPYDPAYAAADTIITADYLLRQMRMSPVNDVLYADAACRGRCAELLRLETSVESILEEGVTAVRFVPVLRPDGTVAAEDAYLDVRREGMRDIAYAQFMQAVGQGGFIWRYYQKLFSLLQEARGRFGADRLVCVQLSTVACMREDAAGALFDLATGAGFSPKHVVFFLPEADVAAAMPVLHDNIRHLAAYGFGFRLDAFAAGYTDLSQLTSLPVSAVKLDCSLVHDARLGGRRRSLLAGTLRILAALRLPVVCAGVDSLADFENAVASGAQLLQGRYVEARAGESID